MRSNVQHALVALATTMAVLCIAAVAYVLLPSGINSVAYVLPAHSTLLVLHPINQDIIDAWSASLPALQSLPAWQAGQSAALLRSADGSLQWHLLDTTSYAPGTPTLNGEEKRLSEDAEYLRLALTRRTDPWLYVHSDAWKDDESQILLSKQSVATAIIRHEDSWSIVRPKTGRTLPPANPLARLSMSPSMTMYASDLASVIESLQTLLSGNVQTLAGVHIATALRTLFGEDLSPRYDLLPLLSGPGQLVIATVDGSTHAAALVTLSKEKSASTATLLHAAFTQNQPLAEQQERTFDDTFTHQAIALRTKELTQQTWEEGGWHFMQTSSSGSLLITAEQDQTIIVATHPALAADMAAFTETSADHKDASVARGTLSTAWIHELLPPPLHLDSSPFAPKYAPIPSSLQWTLRHTRNSEEWTLR